MSFDPLNSPLVLLAGGLVLFIAGLGNALLGPFRRHNRSAVLGLGAATVLLAAAVWRPAALGPAAAAVGCGSFLVVAVGSRRAAVFADRLRQAGAHWCALGALGLVLAVLGVVSLGRDDDPPLLEDTSAMEKVYQNWPPLEFGPAAVTDRGTTIRLEIASASREPARLGPLERQLLDGLGRTTRLIRSQPADDHSNCHGWVFTGGRYWLEVEEAETILRENGYQHVSVPSPGDLVVYRNAQGDPGHTAVVRAVCDDGAVLVEGKWSWMGVYLHRVGDSIFGPHYTFLRSPRPGHLLAGLPAATSP